MGSCDVRGRSEAVEFDISCSGDLRGVLACRFSPKFKLVERDSMQESDVLKRAWRR